MMKSNTKTIHKRNHITFAAIALLFMAMQVHAQPIVDTVKALQKVNEKYYKTLFGLDPNGESYTFTNVIKWKITDRELFDQIKEALTKAPFNVKLDEYRIDDIYLFCAPVSSDRVEPFHILLDGEILEKKVGKKKSSGLGGISDGDEESGVKTKKAFQGKVVVQLMRRNQPLFENINITQGDNVEIPGEIVPTGGQLIKSSQLRYAMSRMFIGFYNKRVILDAQRSLYGLPTSEQQFAEYNLAQTQNSIGTDTTQAIIDSALITSPVLPDESTTFEKLARYERTFDISVDHLNINLNRNFAVELQLGNPEIGLPFWTSGQGRFGINLKNQIGTESDFRLAVAFPLELGKKDAFIWSKRNMSGGWGASISAYFAGIDFFSAFNLPLAFNFTYNPSGGSANSSFIYNGVATSRSTDDVPLDPNGNPKYKTFYRTAMIMQLYIPTIVQLDLHNFIQVSIGVGVHNVQQSIILTADQLNAKKITLNGGNPLYSADKAEKVQDVRRVSTPVNPHLSVEYVNHRSSKFGLGILFDHVFTFSGWIELIEDRLRLETSFTSALLRDAKPWEPGNFFQITPRIYF